MRKDSRSYSDSLLPASLVPTPLPQQGTCHVLAGWGCQRLAGTCPQTSAPSSSSLVIMVWLFLLWPHWINWRKPSTVLVSLLCYVEPERCDFSQRVNIGDKWGELGVLSGAEIGPSHLRRNPRVSLLGTSLGEGHDDSIFLRKTVEPVMKSPG